MFCNLCKKGYYLSTDKKTCTATAADANCASYDEGHETACTLCKDNKVLSFSDNTCKDV